MAKERVYKHPITNIILRTSDAAYALLTGFVPYYGNMGDITLDPETGIEIGGPNGSIPVNPIFIELAVREVNGRPVFVYREET